MANGNSNGDVLASLQGLSVTYRTRLGDVSAVDGVTFDIHRGEILGLVGESGCGKSTMGRAMMRMIAPPGYISGGKMIFDGDDVMTFDQARLRDFRGRCMSMIFQDPMTSLNPVQRVDGHVVEAIQVHEPETTTQKALARARELAERLSIRANRLLSYPHQLSGGMRQRVMISLGLVLNASLVVADEATTSLDVIVEANLLDQLRELRDDFGVSVLVITHNIALVAEVADRIAVMYAGRMAEVGDICDVFDHPMHPYTDGLLRSVPNIRLDDDEELYKMPGEPPNLTHPPSGCRFHPRCPSAMPICREKAPALTDTGDGHLVNCWLYQQSSREGERNAQAAS